MSKNKFSISMPTSYYLFSVNMFTILLMSHIYSLDTILDDTITKEIIRTMILEIMETDNYDNKTVVYADNSYS